MKRLCTTLATLLLASCAATPATSPTPPVASHNTPTASSCNADAAQSVVGKDATPDVVEQARTEAGAKTVRVLKPGQVVTMEYLESRLNVNVDAGNVVTSVTCG